MVEHQKPGLFDYVYFSTPSQTGRPSTPPFHTYWGPFLDRARGEVMKINARRSSPASSPHARSTSSRRPEESSLAFCVVYTHCGVRRGEHTAQQFESELKINRFIAHEIFHSVVFVVVVALAHTHARTFSVRSTSVRSFNHRTDLNQANEIFAGLLANNQQQ